MSKPELLVPVTNTYRESLCLDGSWWFVLGDTEEFKNGVPRQRIAPVPCDLQDLLQVHKERSHVGSAWFEKTVFVPKDWLGEDVYIRLEQIGLRCEVYVNGHEVGRQRYSMTSAVFSITRLIKYGEENRIVIRVLNEISLNQFPLGQVVGRRKKGNVAHVKRHIPFGITGSVHIYKVPHTRVVNVEAFTREITKESAIISYTTEVQGNSLVTVTMRDREGRVVATGVGGQGTLTVEKPNLWDVGQGYLYTIDFEVSRLGKQHDMYRIPFGIRTIEQRDGHLYLNGKMQPLRGYVTTGYIGTNNTFDPIKASRFLESILRVGGNALFSAGSVLPEPFLHLADAYGVCVISDLPFMGLGEQDLELGDGPWEEQFASKRVGPAALQVMEHQITLQRKHPSIIAWTAVTEPSSMVLSHQAFHEGLINHIRKFDETRPIGCAVSLRAQQIHVSLVDLYDFVTLTGPVKTWEHGSAYIEQSLYEDLVDWGVKVPNMELFVLLGSKGNYKGDVRHYYESMNDVVRMLSTHDQVQGIGVYVDEENGYDFTIEVT